MNNLNFIETTIANIIFLVLLFFIVHLGCWTLGSFIEGELLRFNPLDWHPVARLIEVCVFIIVWLILLAI